VIIGKHLNNSLNLHELKYEQAYWNRNSLSRNPAGDRGYVELDTEYIRSREYLWEFRDKNKK
jgi:hypothetical protein